MSVCPSNQACLSVHQIRHVPQSTKSGKSVSPSDEMSVSSSNQTCPSVHPIRHVCLCIKSGMSLSPSNQACPSEPQIRQFCQQRCRGAMCSGTSDPNLSPTKWPRRQGQAMNFFNFYKLSEKIGDFQSSFTVFTIFFLETK